MTKPHYNYIFTIKKGKNVPEDLLKYYYKDLKLIYVSSYELKDTGDYNISIYNFNAFTKEEYFDEFLLPKSCVASIEEIII